MKFFFAKIKGFVLSASEGFTFIEIIVTIAIIGLLAVFIIGNIAGAKQRGRDGQRKSDLSLIQAALEQYKADYNTYPCFNLGDCNGSPGWGDFSTLGQTNLPAKYLNIVPKDPFYKGGCSATAPQYLYWHSATKQQYALFANLEVTTDKDALAVKPTLPAQGMGSCTGTGGSCTQFTITFAGACQGAVYNYWVTNP